MPEGFDVAARLGMGEPSVERIGTYVWACRQLGYQHPDLTVSAAQVRDWYANDDGLDLRALDADCDALSAAAAVADDAVRRHMELSTELAGVWSGGGAGAAREFLWRHGQSAVTVRDGLRRAAEAMTALRDELWRAVDAKVGAVLDIDDRTLPQRAEWLAAAQAVTTGAGDRATASELVDQQIKPFVDNDIRSDWLAAMHRATASATAAYDAASARLDSGAVSTFDVPGELGPRWDGPDGSPASIAAVPAAAVPVATVPAAAVISSPPPAFDPPAAAPAVAPALAPLADPLPAAAAPAAAPASPMPSLGEMGGGMPSLGAGASGFGQQLADLIGGLIGSSGDAPADAQGIDPPNETDGQGDDADQEAKTEPADAGESALDEAADAPEPAAPDETDTEPKPTPEPAATPVPPPPDPALPVPPAVPEALPTEQTPCEIAADELPQVGE